MKLFAAWLISLAVHLFFFSAIRFDFSPDHFSAADRRKMTVSLSEYREKEPVRESEKVGIQNVEKKEPTEEIAEIESSPQEASKKEKKKELEEKKVYKRTYGRTKEKSEAKTFSAKRKAPLFMEGRRPSYPALARKRGMRGLRF